MTSALVKSRFTTIFLTPERRDWLDSVSLSRISRLESDADCVIALGAGDYVNVYSTDERAVSAVVEFLGRENVTEISP